MIKLYKNKNTNRVKIRLLFICQIFLGVLPVVLFVIYSTYVRQLETLDQYETWMGTIFIIIMVCAFVLYTVTSRKYNILVSGRRGERILIKTAKKLSGNYSIFSNLPIRYKKNRSEIDLLIIGENGLLIIEVKNHSGVIIGSDTALTWTHRKYYRKGKTTETEMENPFKQMKRQREILKSILRSNEVDVWIDSILFFSGNPGLKLRVGDEIAVAGSENELIGLINDYQAKNPLPKEKQEQIVKILKDFSV
ncbi:MAG: NERD domain-containing protein [Oscillospiraceae bacterium]|nr:NERD domain-containing protein [Oscillospiraceae bacterium]